MTALGYERPLESPAPPEWPGHDTGGIDSSATLTLQNPDGLVAALLWQAILVKDKSWVNTPLGPFGADYLHWLEHERGRSSETIYSYEPFMALTCRMVRKLPGKVATNDIRRVRNMVEPGQQRKFTALHRGWFRWMYEEGLIPTDPAGRIRYPKKEPTPITDLYTDEEKAAIVTAQTDPMDWAGVLLLLRAGIRKAELRGLQARDVSLSVDPVECFVLVRRGKGGNARPVPIKGELVRALNLLLATDVPGLGRPRLPDEYLLCPKAGGRSTKRVPGRPMGSRGAHEWWYQCLERAGVVDKGVTRGRRMHATRHTYATDLGRATDWNMVAVQKNLGHKFVNTTIDTYTQFTLEDQAAAVAMLPEIGGMTT